MLSYYNTLVNNCAQLSTTAPLQYSIKYSIDLYPSRARVRGRVPGSYYKFIYRVRNVHILRMHSQVHKNDVLISQAPFKQATLSILTRGKNPVKRNLNNSSMVHGVGL